MSKTILFLCPHNAAKSLIAAALCEREAKNRGIDLHIDSAGTEPDAAPMPSVVELLEKEGNNISAYKPRLVSEEELTNAWRVVSLDCDISSITSRNIAMDDWSDVPPPSQDLQGSYDLTHRHVIELLNEIQ